jgi:hypothetical protein
MLKVFGFVRRNPRLTHDEYRAAHVGYHNSFGRRLENIRGYILNVRANRPLDESLGPLAAQITRAEPDPFDSMWDGYGQLMFDNLDHYLSAKIPTNDRAGPNGLQDDDPVGDVGGDGPFLYAGSPFQFHVDEHVAVPVRRPERKLFKLVQFTKRREDLAREAFRAYATGRYATHLSRLPGLRGLIMSFRTPLDVMTGFFPPEADAFSVGGAALRERFFGSWDLITELWFDRPEQFTDGRAHKPFSMPLDALEDGLFERCFYREVDETVAVIPNRAPPPPFYHR